jgi:serine/threonine-protein kinase
VNTDTDKLIGQQINQYRILSHIARGGMARVYLAEDVDLQRKVALKVMLGVLAAADPQFAARFRVEAQMVAKLNHPNIIQVYTVGQTGDGQPYIAMQYIAGGSLQEKLQELADRKKLLTTEQALNTVRQIALALGAAHKAGIVHRDLKPANVLIRPDGSPVLVDLGIAAVQGGAKLTQTGSVIGTPAYMSPEQVRGGPLDGRADLYALGIMLYEILAGIRPFDADESIAVLHKQVYEDPLPLNHLRSDLSPQTLLLVATALQKDPSHRYQSAEEMVQAIDAAIQAEGLHAPNPGATVVLTQMHDSKLISRSRIVQAPGSTATPQPAAAAPTAVVQKRSPFIWPALLLVVLALAALAFFAFRALSGGTAVADVDGTATAVALTLPTDPPAVAPTDTPSADAPTEPPPTIPAAEPGETAVPPTEPPAADTPLPPTEEPPTPVPPASNIPGGGSGLIAYSAQTSQGREIFTYDLVTGATQQITQDSFDDYGPTWSPDGQQIAYSSKRNQQYDVYIIDLRTGVSRNLTSHPDDESYPSWSPDGTQILFHSNRYGEFDIFVINVDGSGLRQLTSNDLPDLGPKWSPDGRQIAFSQSLADRRQLAIMNADGSNIRQITADRSYSHTYPSWSPDGSQLAFYMVPDLSATTGIHIIDANGQNMQQITNNDDFEVEWSPDGEWLLFHRKSGNNRAIYRIRPDGTELTAVVTSPSDVRDAAWQP